MAIDAAEQIEKFQEFLEQSYQKDLHENINKGHQFLLIDFFELTKYDPKLADQLLEEPEETIKAAEMALEQFDVKKGFRIRFRNLPKSQEIFIRNLRSKHLLKFIAMEGIIRQSSEVRPQAVSAKFECPSCGNTLTMLQIDQQFREPTRCSCGRKGKFRLLSKELVDVQRLVIEESPENLEGGAQPKRMQIFLREDLVEPRMERRTTPGTRIIVNGALYEVPIQTKTGATSTRFDLAMQANYIEPVEEDYSEITITPEDEKEIKKIAKDKNVHERLIKSIAPSIYGHEKIKEAMLLQLFGGIRKTKKDGTIVRGDLHVLLVGDPGCGKSQMLTFVNNTAPKSRYVAGRSASGAGLCVSPNSRVLLNPGAIEKISSVVDPRVEGLSEYREGVWKKEKVSDIKVQSMSYDLKVHSQHPAAIWKLESPQKMMEITLQSGKKIELTANTQLYSIDNGFPFWKKSLDFKEGNYVATPRKLVGGDAEKVFIVDLIDSNPVVHNIKDFVQEIVLRLQEKYGSIRVAAKVLSVHENNLYHNWVKKSAHGNIKLQTLKKLATDVGLEYRDKVTIVSLYNGKKHTLPIYVSRDLLYIAGLLVGDGHLRKLQTYTFGLSNSSETLQDYFQSVIKKEFSLHFRLEKAVYGKRPPCTIVHSKLLGEILLHLGMKVSPKSNIIHFTPTLLHFSNHYLASFIAGYFDSDGSVGKRKESNRVEIAFCSASEQMLRELQLVLLRYGMHWKLRVRPAVEGKIRSKFPKWELSTSAHPEIQRFYHSIPIKHPLKFRKLENRLQENIHTNTNLDIIPGVQYRVKEALQERRLSLKKHKWHIHDFSPAHLKEILKTSGIKDKELFDLAESDIYWEKVVSVREFTSPYEFVYDLTVENSHNFVVDGVLVHNTCSVVKDEFLRGWALEAGAMVLADKGILVLDEMDKISKEDTSALHEAMEQQHISVAKANIQATLRTQTSILGAANPKLGRFDPFTPIPNQIDMPPALINRFDLIFVMRDIPNKELDGNIATRVLQAHAYKDVKPELEAPFIRKYLAYAKQKIFPVLTDQAVETIKKFYVELRSTGSSGDGAIKPIPISARQLEAVVRLAEASARIKLKKEVEEEDALRAIALMKWCMTEVGMDPETGKIDIDRMTTGISASTRGRIIDVKEVLYALSEEKQGGPISIEDDLKPKVFAKGITEKKLEEAIDMLKRSGDFYEPKKGWLQKI